MDETMANDPPMVLRLGQVSPGLRQRTAQDDEEVIDLGSGPS
jgi:hypothetical protein